MKCSVLLTTVLFAAGMVFAQQTSGTTDHSKTKNKQAQTDNSASQSTPRETTENKTEKTPSATAKSKTIRVVGKVTAYEAGKKLTVTTPKKHSRSFDLNAKNTTVNGAENVKQGDMVRVTEMTENGQHTITIQPYTSASARHSKSASHQPKASQP